MSVITGGGPPHKDEQCPKRAAGLTHTQNGTPTCVHCGLWTRTSGVPTAIVREVKDPPPSEAWDGRSTGLIDGLLDRRLMPDPRYLPAYLAEETFAEGYLAGIDTALDLLVPATKAILLLPSEGVGAISRGAVEKLIGRVPIERNRYGWQKA